MTFNFDNLEDDLRNRGFENVAVIGDVHGMTSDFESKIKEAQNNNNFIIQLGDIVDYGPDSVGCVNLMFDVISNNSGLMILGNHERKLEKYIHQKRVGDIRVNITGGIVATVEQLEALSLSELEDFENKFLALCNQARHHIRLGRRLFVHGSATKKMWESNAPRLKGYDESRAVFGQVDKTQPMLPNGYPNRIYDWVDEIPTEHKVFVGHDIRDYNKPFRQMGKLGGEAIFVDTGSGKGGVLSSVIEEI